MANYKTCALFHLVFAVVLISGSPGDNYDTSRIPNIFDSFPVHAATIRNALNNRNGFSQADERAIIDVFVGRPPCHFSFINSAYKKLDGKNMLTDLRANLNPKVADFIFASMKYANDYYSEKLHEAMSKNPIDEDTIIDVFSTFKGSAVRRVVQTYKELYIKSLKSDLEIRTTGDLRNLLVTIVEVDTPDNNYVDHNQAIADAEELYNAEPHAAATWRSLRGIPHSGPMGPTFLLWNPEQFATREQENFASLINKIFSSRSDAQLRQTILEYRRISSNRSITDVISRQNFSGCTKKLLLAIVERVESENDFYAIRLHQSVDGKVNDPALNLFFVPQKIELRRGSLKAFEKRYGKSFESFIPKDPSNNYYYALRSLVRISS